MKTSDFSTIKSHDYAEAMRISISDVKGELLIPLGAWVLSDQLDILNDMWSWRRHNASSFFFSEPPTLQSFSEYLNHGPILNDERVLFLVVMDNLIVGHMGLIGGGNKSATIDNVLRGRDINQTAKVGIMQRALNRMMTWANEVYGICNFDLEVRSDNERAIGFYERCGFSKSRIVQIDSFEINSKLPNSQGEILSKVIMSKTLSPKS